MNLSAFSPRRLSHCWDVRYPRMSNDGLETSTISFELNHFHSEFEPGASIRCTPPTRADVALSMSSSMFRP